ncbi:MAG: hypothetical protein H5U38_10615 [Calditrichaeota bacterium]|nr:hypothetical protein [Calditrichota bacterium]
MKLMRVASLLLWSFVFLSCSSKVDRIVDKHIAARGGYERLKAITSKRLTGTIVQGEARMPFELLAKRPNRVRLSYDYEGGTMVAAYDGTVAWVMNPALAGDQPLIIEPERAKDLIALADFDGPLLDYREKGHHLRLLKEAYIKGAKAYTIEVSLANGDVLRVYLDKKSFLERRWDDEVLRHGALWRAETYLDDYRPEQGIMLEHYKETRLGGELDNIVITEQVEFNLDLPDSLFSPPGTPLARTRT